LIQDTGIPLEIARKALSRIYELDPVGCGARDVQESLYIQARLLQPEYEIAHRLLETYFEEIEKLDYKKIEKATSYSSAEIDAAIQFIRSLEPFPGTMHAPAQPEYVLPDLVVLDLGGDLEIVINDEWIPSLRVNDEYKQILKEGQIGNEMDREYLQTRLNSAQWLIKSISQRRHTLLKVMQAILEFQSEFFKKGHGYLKPLTLKDVAEKVELHESTVSRITTNKYVQTRWGFFELKYFFSSSLKSVGGGDGQSARNIQDRVKKIIDEEDPNNPLSDQEIVDLIRKEGVEIARRTVAKYRKILKILPADRRKKLKGLNSGG
jgi:RNA polymerase sigma-54 factor